MNFSDDNENFNKKVIIFKREVERLFNDLFSSFPNGELPYSLKAGEAPIDIYISNDKLITEIELPGISREDLSIGIRDNVLAIMWKLKPRIESKVKFFCMERRFGKFEKFILLPISPSKQDIEAKLSNGVLKISFELGDILRYSRTGIPINYDK